ncbi:hypothetical protein [uncultured Aquimarina sp.]|uniref:hypothetical protein n=1 Tax=uncultured Aquimarina sp. TaxID=575652 RepID=UPI0026191D10|nr:hypothetical protein [uncultured Aquimarina sp.]
MKRILLISFVFLLSCKTEQKNDFQKYLESLDKIELPFQYNSTNGFVVESKSKKFNQDLYKKYKQIWAEKPVGILYNDGKNIIIPEIVVGDYTLTPYLMVYNNIGEKLDSLNVFKKSGMDMLYEAFEYATVNNKIEVTVVDSVYTWKESEDKNDRDPLTKTLSTGKTMYKLNSNGKFENKK